VLFRTQLLVANFSVVAPTSSGSSAAPAPSTSPTSPVPSSTDDVHSLPTWVLITLIVLVALVVAGMFALTWFNLSAPRSTLKNILGLKPRVRRRPTTGTTDGVNGLLNLAGSSGDKQRVSQHVLDALSSSARVGKRTTRTTLAITGFALLGVIVIAVFGLNGPGVRDLRSQVVASVVTLVASIAGFFFGSQSGGGANPPPAEDKSATGSGPTGSPGGPTLAPDPDSSHASFTVGTPGSYSPVLTAADTVVVTVTFGQLPAGLTVDPATGVISGAPAAGAAGTYKLSLTASTGTGTDASLPVTLTVS
jgi:hypothetical protein